MPPVRLTSLAGALLPRTRFIAEGLAVSTTGRGTLRCSWFFPEDLAVSAWTGLELLLGFAFSSAEGEG